MINDIISIKIDFPKTFLHLFFNLFVFPNRLESGQMEIQWTDQFDRNVEHRRFIITTATNGQYDKASIATNDESINANDRHTAIKSTATTTTVPISTRTSATASDAKSFKSKQSHESIYESRSQ